MVKRVSAVTLQMRVSAIGSSRGVKRGNAAHPFGLRLSRLLGNGTSVGAGVFTLDAPTADIDMHNEKSQIQNSADAQKTESVWMDISMPSFRALDDDLEVDVVIVGAGLTGITAAYMLSREGVKVALIDRGPIAGVDTSRTTAHLTYVTDSRLHELVAKFGADAARAFWEAGGAAIDEIDRIVREHRIECDFRWTSGYLHESLRKEPDPKELARLKRDAELARELGFDATLVASVPYAHRVGVRFDQQAKFHPRKYLRALLPLIEERGGLIFEDTAFEAVESEPLAVSANGKRIRCDYLMIASHNPLMGRLGTLAAAAFQTKLSLYTSYVLGARLPRDTLPEALYWDTSDPYDYLRVDTNADGQYAIFGGDDVKTGQEKDTHAVFRKLTERFRSVLPMAAAPEHRWMGQVVETDDGMPFIGENAPRQFVATGFCGNGFTLGTLAAMMIRDRILDRPNPWSTLLDTGRLPFHGGVWRYVRENLDYPYYMVRDRLARAESGSIDDLASEEGRILKVDGRKVAAYRDAAGTVTLLSPVCTHLGCIVRWNRADRTWDCPCHGSRFHPAGEVLSGPAEKALERVSRSQSGS